MMIEHLRYLELQRAKQQMRLDSSKSRAERNKLGQFATPLPLALAMAEQAKQFVPEEIPIQFLDPALGTGVFYSAILQVFRHTQIANAAGYEIDREYGRVSYDLWNDYQMQVVNEDFTKAKPPSRNPEKFNLIICNPPYIRHHHLTQVDKTSLQSKTHSITTIRPSKLSGLYVYFMLLAHEWLQEDGISGWLIPSEFMDVNYGSAVRHYLTSQVMLLNIHRFEPEDVQFDDALVSSVIVWFRKRKPSKFHSVPFSLGQNSHEATYRQTLSVETLKHENKWSRFPKYIKRDIHSSSLFFRDIFEVKRGIATGANDFFIVNDQKVSKHNLPFQFLTPILPSPRYLASDEILADSAGFPLIDHSRWIIDCDLPEFQIAKNHPNLWNYLQLGISRQVHEGFLCRNRTPWYRQDKRQPAPFLCTYMGRMTDDRSGNPFRFIINHSRAVTPNVYLNIYPKNHLSHMIETKPDLKYIIWRCLQSIPLDQLIGEGRVYGGGLYKLEPKELGNLPIDEHFKSIPELTRRELRQPTLL